MNSRLLDGKELVIASLAGQFGGMLLGGIISSSTTAWELEITPDEETIPAASYSASIAFDAERQESSGLSIMNWDNVAGKYYFILASDMPFTVKVAITIRKTSSAPLTIHESEIHIKRYLERADEG